MWVNRPRPVETAGAQAGERRVAGSPSSARPNAHCRAVQVQPITVQVRAAKGQHSLRQEIEIKAGTEVGSVWIFPRHHH